MVTVVGRIEIHEATVYGWSWTKKVEGKLIQHMIYCSNGAYDW